MRPRPSSTCNAPGPRECGTLWPTPGVLLPVPMLEQLRSQGLTDYRAFFQPFGSAVDPRLWPDLPSGRAVREGISVSFATTRADGVGEDERTTLRRSLRL